MSTFARRRLLTLQATQCNHCSLPHLPSHPAQTCSEPCYDTTTTLAVTDSGPWLQQRSWVATTTLQSVANMMIHTLPGLRHTNHGRTPTIIRHRVATTTTHTLPETRHTNHDTSRMTFLHQVVTSKTSTRPEIQHTSQDTFHCNHESTPSRPTACTKAGQNGTLHLTFQQSTTTMEYDQQVS